MLGPPINSLSAPGGGEGRGEPLRTPAACVIMDENPGMLYAPLACAGRFSWQVGVRARKAIGPGPYLTQPSPPPRAERASAGLGREADQGWGSGAAVLLVVLAGLVAATPAQAGMALSLLAPPPGLLRLNVELIAGPAAPSPCVP